MSKKTRKGNYASYTPEKPLFGKYAGTVYRSEHGVSESAQKEEELTMIHSKEEKVQFIYNTPPEILEEIATLRKELEKYYTEWEKVVEDRRLLIADHEALLKEREEERRAAILDPFEEAAGEIPPALVKATCDPFDYALGLRDGRTVRFQEAKLCKGEKWVTLYGSGYSSHSPYSEGSIEMSHIDHNFPRGIDVRLSDIIWVSDAPSGS